MNTHVKKYVTECIGTFALALVVTILASQNSPVTPFAAALTLALFVYSVGHISGAHFNPAVTLGAFSIKKIDGKSVLGYLIAQFLGAFFAFRVAALLVSHLTDKLSPIMTRSLNDPSIAFAEGLGMFFFAFGIASVIYGRTPKDVSGLMVGGSLLVGIFIASTLSNGILNPAVAFSLGSFNFAYLFGPIIGAMLGMYAYSTLSEEA